MKNTTKNPTIIFNDMDTDGRLAELILYVSKKCQGHTEFGATKLNKILWFSDFLAYQRFGKPITGSEYMKLEHGPAPRRLLPVREKLIKKDKRASLQNLAVLGGTQQRLIAIDDPDLNNFSAGEIDLVNEIINLFKDVTAVIISEVSHNRIWRIAGDEESIPYEAVFVSDDNPTEFDTMRAQELIAEHVWDV